MIKHVLDSLDLHLGYQGQRRTLERLRKGVREEFRSLPAEGYGGLRGKWRRDRIWQKVKHGLQAIHQMRHRMHDVE